MVIGRAGTEMSAQTVLNGELEPTVILKAGMRHRLRFVNITPNDVFVVSLATASDPVQWCPVTKDGAPLPVAAAASRPATQKIAVGETYDFEYRRVARTAVTVAECADTRGQVAGAGPGAGQVSPRRWAPSR